MISDNSNNIPLAHITAVQSFDAIKGKFYQSGTRQLSTEHCISFLQVSPFTQQKASLPSDKTEISFHNIKVTEQFLEIANTCIVTSAEDKGSGTLRWCLENAESGITIIFDPSVFPPSSPTTILLNNSLIIHQGNITIDGSDAGVILTGNGSEIGLDLISDNNIIRGLQIYNFSIGIKIDDCNNNVIGGNRSKGAGPIGQGNVISGNRNEGIYIGGGNSAINNLIIGNLIGTDVSGLNALGNHGIGVYIGGMATTNNQIGGTNLEDRNIISGNKNNGISLMGTQNNLVIGNYIGTDVTGTIALGNRYFGVSMETIGGTINCKVQENLVSGNGRAQIYIGDPGSDYNVIVGNLVGTDASGTKVIPYSLGGGGISIGGGASFNRIGGTNPQDRNIISGNGGGAGIGGDSFGGSTRNLILGNFIGTDISGTQLVGNMEEGCSFGAGASCNIIGGTTATERNIISGNALQERGEGIEIQGDYNYLLGNYIGTDITGSVAISNGRFGVGVNKPAKHNVIQSNIIAYTTFYGEEEGGVGVHVDSSPYNTIRRNTIYGNAGKGIIIINGGYDIPSVPIITAVTNRSVSGTTHPVCTVEIFSDTEEEGQVYEGSTVTDDSGRFVFHKGSSLFGPNITVTVTDNNGSTSEFSIPVSTTTTTTINWEVWSFSTGGEVYSSPALGDVDGDGVVEVVVGSSDSKIYCLNGTSGVQEWSFTTGGKVYSSPALADVDGDGQVEVVVGSFDNNTYCLDGASGVQEWAFTTGWEVYSSPALGDIDGDGQVEVVIGSEDHKVYCLCGMTGNEEWAFTTGWEVSASPSLGDVDGDGQMEVMIGSEDHKVYCLSGTTGDEEWSFHTGGDVGHRPVLADVDGDGQIEVVVGSASNKTYCLDGATNTVEWVFIAGDAINSNPTLGDVDRDGQIEIVIGSMDHKVYSLNGATGDEEWSFTTNDRIFSSPVLGDVDGDTQIEVLIGSDDENLYCLNGITGNEEWFLNMGGNVRSGPTLGDVDGDGKIEVLVGSNNHKLYCIASTSTHLFFVEKDSYEQGETVHLKAITSPYTNTVFKVNYPDGTLHSSYNNQSNVNGLAFYSFTLETNTPIGNYTVFFSTIQATISTSFEVTKLIDTTPPQITGLTHSPIYPQPTDIITIRATVSDTESDILGVTVYYSTDGGSSWSNKAMTGVDSLYSTTIGFFSPGTSVQFYINATDNAGNSQISDTQSFSVIELITTTELSTTTTAKTTTEEFSTTTTGSISAPSRIVGFELLSVLAIVVLILPSKRLTRKK